MTKKKKKFKYFDTKRVKREKRGYWKFIFMFAILLTLGLLALIGFNAFLFYSSTNIFLAYLVEELGQYVFLINCGLIFFVGFIGLFLWLEVSSFKSFREMNTFQPALSLDRLERLVLQFLTDNEGKAFTSASLIDRINHERASKELDGVLSNLVEDNKIIRTKNDDTIYYSKK